MDDPSDNANLAAIVNSEGVRQNVAYAHTHEQAPHSHAVMAPTASPIPVGLASAPEYLPQTQAYDNHPVAQGMYQNMDQYQQLDHGHSHGNSLGHGSQIPPMANYLPTQSMPNLHGHGQFAHSSGSNGHSASNFPLFGMQPSNDTPRVMNLGTDMNKQPVKIVRVRRQ